MLAPLDYTPACVAGIELFLFGTTANPGAPVVFVAHGRGGAAAHTFNICRDLADAGMIAITFDQRNHGRRMVDPRANDGWSPRHAADMYSNVVGTAQDVSLLIDLIPACLGLPMTQIGMTGISMGGHATLMAMAHDARISVGAPLIGAADYRRLMELRAEENECTPEEFDAYFPPALQEFVAKYDPINLPANFADRPLLMANGEADRLVPIECNRHFLNACRPYYQHSERLVLKAFPDLGHSCPPDMIGDMISWFRHWLLADAGVTAR